MFNFPLLILLIVIGITFSADPRCRNEPNGNLLPLPERNSYLRCFNGVATVHTCQNNQEFNPFDRTCTIVAASSVTGNRPNMRQSNICANQPDGTLLADTSSRSNYIKCNNGESTIKTCSSGQEFNSERSMCIRNSPTRPPQATQTTTVNRQPPRPPSLQPTRAPAPRPRPMHMMG